METVALEKVWSEAMLVLLEKAVALKVMRTLEKVEACRHS
jgi:hypothetical protein